MGSSMVWCAFGVDWKREPVRRQLVATSWWLPSLRSRSLLFSEFTHRETTNSLFCSFTLQGGQRRISVTSVSCTFGKGVKMCLSGSDQQFESCRAPVLLPVLINDSDLGNWERNCGLGTLLHFSVTRGSVCDHDHLCGGTLVMLHKQPCKQRGSLIFRVWHEIPLTFLLRFINDALGKLLPPVKQILWISAVV